jgi:hypothetical protein
LASNEPSYDYAPATYDPAGDGIYTAPVVDAPVVEQPATDDGGEYRGPFGYVAAVTEPWKGMGIPIGRSACIYSDSKSITVYHPLAGTTPADLGGRYADKLISKGWSQQSDYTYDTMRSMTLTKGSESLSLSSMIYEENIIVSIAKY